MSRHVLTCLCVTELDEKFSVGSNYYCLTCMKPVTVGAAIPETPDDYVHEYRGECDECTFTFLHYDQWESTQAAIRHANKTGHRTRVRAFYGQRKTRTVAKYGSHTPPLYEGEPPF